MPVDAHAARSPFTAVRNGVSMRVRVVRKAGGNVVAGIRRDAEGAVLLKVAVTGPAGRGRAHAAGAAPFANVPAVATTGRQVECRIDV
ncbi:MAG: hypothetical protein EA406_05000 [Rhodospirillales bacterium]|nr:MAG: hypothetical protein EA406_05000 [Rhodospirillales bacterium]